MKNKLNLSLRKTEIEWFLTFPDVSLLQEVELRKELASLSYQIYQMKGGAQKW